MRWEGTSDLGHAFKYMELAPQDRMCVFSQKKKQQKKTTLHLYGCCNLDGWWLGCLRDEVLEVWGLQRVEEKVRITATSLNVKEFQSVIVLSHLPRVAYVSYLIGFVAEACFIYQVPPVAYFSTKEK